MRSIGVALLLLAPGFARAQSAAPPAARTPATQPTPDESAEEPGDIIVRGQRQRGAAIGDIPPEVSITPAEIRSYGVSSVAELLAEIAPETRSGRGRGGEQPVVLLNGRRISGFSEIRDLPAEAIARVDILPEEVALKYGYRADQKVVNFVLRRRFRSLTADLADRIATDGGRTNPEIRTDLLALNRDGRSELTLDYQTDSALTEAERGIRPLTSATLPGQGVAVDQPDISRLRTLLPSTTDFSANATINRTVIGNIQGTINGRYELVTNDSLLGPQGGTLVAADGTRLIRYPPGIRPLARSDLTETSHGGLTLDGDLAKGAWRWSLTGNYDRVRIRTLTDGGLDLSAAQARIAADPAFDPRGTIPSGLIGTLPASTARSLSSIGGLDLLVNGDLLKLPAGGIATSLRVGGQFNDFDSRSFRGGIVTAGSVSRRIVNGQLNVDVPIASRREGVLAAIGDLSVNGNLAVDHLSDFGTLKTIGYGLNWSPVAPVHILLSTTDEHGAPTPQQLGDPLIATPNVRVLDFVTGRTVAVTQTTGGNPALIADHRRVFKAELTLKPKLAKGDLSITANYVQTRINNPIATFPIATAEIEAAFPTRFVRDQNGDLVSIDSRPVNFQSERTKQLRWGFDFSKPLKTAAPAGLAGDLPQRGSGGTRPGGGQGRGSGSGRAFGGNGGGRLQFAAYHTWYFQDDIAIRPGVPVLDLLDGSAIGSNGGQPRHEVELQGGYQNHGWGLRLNGDWKSGSTVRGGAFAPGETLRFSDLATLNARLFTVFSQRPDLIAKHPWLRGARVVLSVDNLFNRRQRVTDQTGAVPLSYQPGYLDPLGRTIRISLRKLLF